MQCKLHAGSGLSGLGGGGSGLGLGAGVGGHEEAVMSKALPFLFPLCIRLN